MERKECHTIVDKEYDITPVESPQVSSAYEEPFRRRKKLFETKSTLPISSFHGKIKEAVVAFTMQ